MKVSDYPKTVEKSEQYSTRDIAVLFRVSYRLASKMIDQGIIPGFAVPGSKQRRVLHSALMGYLEANPQYQYVLERLV